MEKFVRRAALGSAAFLAVLIAAPASTQQRSAAPVARYTMDAGTTSGLAAMAGGGAGVMSILRGGGGGPAHELRLRLGSSRPSGDGPQADHFMPSGAGLGRSVPLVSPMRQAAPRETVPATPGQMQMPSGRLYLFWGCGEHAGPGQPVVIDFAKMARGEMPPGLFASGLDLPEEWFVGPENSTTFGEWPNGRDAKPVPASASLRGDHRIAGNYSPEFAFSLDRDFMPALQPRSQALPSGAFAVNWNGLPDATGYYAWAMGAKDMGRGQASEMVWWTSSATQQFGGSLWDWVSPAAAAKLVAAKTAMPPGQTSCTVPAEVREAGGEAMMLNLTAYGPQSDFAYPPRPAGANAAWNPEWIARVRFRSNAMVMLGMPDMGGMDDPGEEADTQPRPPTKPKCPGGLRGAAMRAAGLCG